MRSIIGDLRSIVSAKLLYLALIVAPSSEKASLGAAIIQHI